MQSGRRKVGQWVLEYVTPSARNPEALMGWVASEDTLNQVKLKFDCCEDAQTYATEQGWDFVVANANIRKVKPRNYSDAFKT